MIRAMQNILGGVFLVMSPLIGALILLGLAIQSNGFFVVFRHSLGTLFRCVRQMPELIGTAMEWLCKDGMIDALVKTMVLFFGWPLVMAMVLLEDYGD